MSAVEAFKPEEFISSIGLSNWVNRAVPSYDSKGKPSFIDQFGDLIEGIYLGMPNSVYHGLPAMSSSAMKKFVESPALYARHYLSDVKRKRSVAQKRTFDAGTYGHELCLEAEGFYSRYFRDVVAADYPDALHTIAQIEAALVAVGETANESKEQKLARLMKADPTIHAATAASLRTIREIEAELDKRGLSKSETKLDKAYRLLAADKTAQVFDVFFEQNRQKHGIETKVDVDGEKISFYGGKCPIDGIVWDDAHRVQRTVRNHRDADAALQNGLPEVTIIARCPLTRMMLKVKFDWLGFDDTASDVKTTRDTKPSKFKHQIEDLKYHIQQEFYKYVAELAGIFIERFTFIAVEYINADICQPYELSEQRTLRARREFMTALTQFVKCKTENRWYGWSEEDCTMVLH